MVDPDDWNVAAKVTYVDGTKRTYLGLTKEELEWFIHMDGDHVKSWYMIKKGDEHPK